MRALIASAILAAAGIQPAPCAAASLEFGPAYALRLASKNNICLRSLPIPGQPECWPHSGVEMIHVLVHDKKDTVGVIVVEGIKAGQELTGWVMEDDSTIKVKALNDIPIGHKVATRGIRNGDTVIKYGFDIGKAVADIKTKRW